ncbi:hypothetical protein MTP99_006731 [Tenebrio molitor]|nr:hypothetical protein MTP99_006731 [Tenebrio molitor]
MPNLTENAKVLILSKLEEGWSIRRVAQHYNIAKSTVRRVKQRWQEHGHFARKAGAGRPKVSTAEQDQALLNRLRENPFEPSTQAASVTNFPGSQSTVCRRIQNSELASRSSARKPPLTEQQKQSRIIFGLNYMYREPQFWNNVIFTDEKNFQSRNSGRIRVYRPKNTRFHERYVTPSTRSGRFSVNVWAWISQQGAGVAWRIDGILNGQKYLDILENVMLPTVSQLYGNNFIFLQDNCPVHNAGIVRQWFATNNIEVMPWPSNSPDLNVIEKVWGLLVKKIYRRNFRPQNANELWATIEEGWEELSQDQNLWENLISSMPRRLNAVVEANGAMTKY